MRSPISGFTFTGARILLTAFCLLSEISTSAAAAEPREAVELAHHEIWRRFIDSQNVMLDFTELDGSVSLPTPEECREGKPNALGWWSPIENGPMFNGMYLDGVLARWRKTHDPVAVDEAERLVRGLLLLSRISDVPGFIGRGVSTDGRSHYPMGSNDQTLPWFYGLWRYLDTDLPTPELRKEIITALTSTADVIVKLKWQMPAEQPFGIRGGFGAITFESAPRLLFVSKMMHMLTGDAKWDGLYRSGLSERGGPANLTRLEICQRGMVFEHGGRHSWTSVCPVLSIRALWEMEQDPDLKAAYAQGLQASADLAIQSLPLAKKFDVNDSTRFDGDWRKMNEMWVPQTTEKEAQALAQRQLKDFIKLSMRRARETEYIREPTFAAWIVTLAPDADVLRQRIPQLEELICTYPYDRLYYSQFFPVEAAWWRMQSAVN